MSEPSDIEALMRRIDAFQTTLQTNVIALQTNVNALRTDVKVLKTDISVLKTDISVLKTNINVRKTNDEMNRATLARMERHDRDILDGQMRFRSEMDALRDSVRSATSGPLNEVQALKSALAEAEFQCRMLIAQHAQDSVSLARAQAAQEMAEERANLLPSRRSLAVGAVFSKKGKATQTLTAPTASEFREGSKDIDNQEEEQAAHYLTSIDASKATASRAQKLNKHDDEMAAQQQAQACNSASRIDTRSEGNTPQKLAPKVSLNARLKMLKEADIRTLWVKSGKSATPAHAEASAAQAQTSAAHAEASAAHAEASAAHAKASAPDVQTGASNVRASASGVRSSASNVQASARDVQPSAADAIVVLSSEEEENMEPPSPAENVALGKKPPPTPSSGESSEPVCMPGKKARKQDSD